MPYGAVNYERVNSATVLGCKYFASFGSGDAIQIDGTVGMLKKMKTVYSTSQTERRTRGGLPSATT